MERPISLAIGAMALLLAPGGSLAQSGKITEAAGGYTFEEAAEENSATSDFHSADGHLTFAVVTQTAGNGFFDPLYATPPYLTGVQLGIPARRIGSSNWRLGIGEVTYRSGI